MTPTKYPQVVNVHQKPRATVETVAKALNVGIQEIFERFRGSVVNDRTVHNFRIELENLLTAVSTDVGEESPLPFINIIIETDKSEPSTLFVSFQPKTTRLGTPTIVEHTAGKEGRAPIFCAFIDQRRQISGWGPTPIHAVADLEKIHGDKH